jgi:segregation and condensation protein B
MEARDRALDAQYPDVSEVVSAEPMAEAPLESVAEAIPGYAVAADAFAPSEDEPVPAHRNGKLRHVLECILFVSSEPMTAKQMADTLEIEQERVEDALATLEEDLNCGHGLQLLRTAGAYQLSTRPEFGDYCAMILQPAKKKLSKAALETLAVVAYRQPCTMPEVEAVRGVSVDGVMKTLGERGLVREGGRKQAPGRPILYATTEEFLEYFGLNDISELPDIDMLAVEEVKALEAQKELLSF